jgi:hypothetical protein
MLLSLAIHIDRLAVLEADDGEKRQFYDGNNQTAIFIVINFRSLGTHFPFSK